MEASELLHTLLGRSFSWCKYTLSLEGVLSSASLEGILPSAIALSFERILLSMVV